MIFTVFLGLRVEVALLLLVVLIFFLYFQIILLRVLKYLCNILKFFKLRRDLGLEIGDPMEKISEMRSIMLLEIGYDQAKAVSVIAFDAGYKCEVYKDYGGNDRVAFLTRSKNA